MNRTGAHGRFGRGMCENPPVAKVPADTGAQSAGEDPSGVVATALRLGVLMLASGAQTSDVETSLHTVLSALAVSRGDAVITYATVTVSYLADGNVATATQAVRRWDPDYSRLAATAELVTAIQDHRVDLATAERELGRIAASGRRYPRWLGFSAPALLSFAVTIMFGGSLGDAATTLGIGLVIQPALERIERSELSAFFQVAVGVTATSLLVVLLVLVGLPVDGGLVLTGSLLRFLPGAVLVSGMRDFIDGAILTGTARLAEVALLGAAIAGAASLILALGETWGVSLGITAEGVRDWPLVVLVVAGMAAITCYALRLDVPARMLPIVAAIGGLAVVVTRSETPGIDTLGTDTRVLVAALAIGALGALAAHRRRQPAAIWTVPAILPLLPAPSTLLPTLTQTELARQELQGQAITTAFCIGVGVAVGVILVETSFRYRARMRVRAGGNGAVGRSSS